MTTLNDIEQLGYLGMRLALRRRAAPELRNYAGICAKTRNRNLRHWLDNEELPRLVIDGLENVISAHQSQRGVVVTSFQIGPYNWIPLVLNKKAQLPVSLLMDEANFKEEQRRWTSRERHYQGSLTEPVRYINSEEPTAVWKMACSLRERRTLVGWFDGHTGVTETNSAKSSLGVKFCETSMRVRTGLAYLSARTGAPLILAMVRNDGEDGVAINFAEPLRKESDETLDSFCRRASEHFVSILEREVGLDPACWEEWCHFHSWNIFDWRSRPGSVLDEQSFLDTVWRFDQDSVDLLPMSSGDVLVSLNSGEALAMTPLLTAVHDTLVRARTAREIVTSLAPEFSSDDVANILRFLREAQFIVEAVRAEDGAPAR